MVIALRNNHWSRQCQANAFIHPVTGREMEYMVPLKDPRLQLLLTRGFGKNEDASVEAFGTFLEPTRVSPSNSLTSRKTKRSLTAK
jgi:hypothetical protein